MPEPVAPDPQLSLLNTLLNLSKPVMPMVTLASYETLEKLRAEDQAEPMVRRYFEILGIPS